MKSKFSLFCALLLIWLPTYTCSEGSAPKLSSEYKNGRWTDSKFKGYKFILNRDFGLKYFESSRSGLFREYYDTSKWERQYSDETETSLIFKSKRNKLVTTFIGVSEGVFPEEEQRKLFEQGFRKGGFKIKWQSYGTDLVNERSFKTVYYLLDKGKGEIVSYNMFYAAQNRTIFVVQTCAAAVHVKVYQELMELVSGLEVGSKI